ncbi:MAG TPA: six-hairpin glycosidase [Verrucomicrobia bacterium]|nr:six-hairpin glycosidase [Verrucomicrobiota bacterium]
MNKSMACGFLGALTMVGGAAGMEADYPIQPVPFTDVHIEAGFWLPRMETNRKVTVPYDFQKCEETGRNSNFAKAAGMIPGDFEGIFFNDSDVFKIIEGAAYTLALHPDPELDAYLDDLIGKIAGAQEEDGYLYTARTINPEKPGGGASGPRWGNIRDLHELYNVGHLYEAAVAHYQATGKRTLLDVAIKNADLIAREFGPGKRQDPPGHEEIEIGLARLYRVTGDSKYLDLAKFFLDVRGRADTHTLYGFYAQDHLPVIEQKEAVGHAVRAGYLYSGMADIAALTGDAQYVDAIGTIWDNIVSKKLYLTGGIGARHAGEAFGDNYELPNRTAYNETCAAVANAMLNHRLFLLHGDSKYIDVLERVIYNGFLSGVSMEGDTFFYPNPLEADGHQRSPWFGCSCCPANVVRFVPSLPGYAYATRDSELFVNLYYEGSAEMALESAGAVKIRQKTEYPWDGRIEMQLEVENPSEFALNLRIPGWAMGVPVPSDLYRYTDPRPGKPELSVNGTSVELLAAKGYATIQREWKTGDRIVLELPMQIRRVVAHPEVEADRGRVALERGPIVFCAEGIDNGGRVFDFVLPDEAELRFEKRDDLLNGVGVLTGQAQSVQRSEDGGLIIQPKQLTAIPYYAWAHRGPGEMQVWFAHTPEYAVPAPLPTIASTSALSVSHCWSADSITAINNLEMPESSSDQNVGRQTFWDHRGTAEWLQYDFLAPTKISGTSVFWFDDTGSGSCRVPAACKVLVKTDGVWTAPAESTMPCEKDVFNTLEFPAVEAEGIRLEIQLQPDYSAGVLEWSVEAAR